MIATDLKCPTCSRPKGTACIKLVRTPDQRVVWSGTDPHAARTVAADARA